MKIAELWRFPVKSMDGESPAALPVLPSGIPGDRGWAVYDRVSGRPLSAKQHAGLMLCRARYAEEPKAGKPPPPAEIVLPDGTRTATDSEGSSELLSMFLNVPCVFGRRPDGAGHFDDKPLHLLTTASLKTMRASSGLDFDSRRFRANVLIESDAAGRPEDGWLERELLLGAVRVWVHKRVRRCVMTTLPQPEVPAEKGILQALADFDVTLGVYAEALAAGTLSIGDVVDASGQKS